MTILSSLTLVDPVKRGDMKARRQIGRPVGMDRIHQKFSALAATAVAMERGRVRS